jgi:hypothetical protein
MFLLSLVAHVCLELKLMSEDFALPNAFRNTGWGINTLSTKKHLPTRRRVEQQVLSMIQGL